MTFSLQGFETSESNQKSHTYKPTFTAFSQPVWVISEDGRFLAIGFRMKQGSIVYVTQFNEEIPAADVTDLLALKTSSL
jgi:hypothetical protein